MPLNETPHENFLRMPLAPAKVKTAPAPPKMTVSSSAALVSRQLLGQFQ